MVRGPGGRSPDVLYAIVNAVARFRWAEDSPPSIIFDEVLERVRGGAVEQLGPDYLAHILFAFVKTGRRDATLFDAVVKVLAPGSAAPQWGIASTRINVALSRFAWAFAKALRHDEAVFTLIASKIEASGPLLDELPNKRFLQLAWAFASAGRKDNMLFGALANALPVRIGKLSIDELSSLLTAFCRADRHDDSVFGCVSRSLAEDRTVDLVLDKPLVSLVTSFAKAGRRDEVAFNVTARAAAPHGALAGQPPRRLADLAWAFATAGRRDEDVFGAVERILSAGGEGTLARCDGRERAQLAWAFQQAQRTCLALGVDVGNDKTAAEGRACEGLCMRSGAQRGGLPRGDDSGRAAAARCLAPQRGRR